MGSCRRQRHGRRCLAALLVVAALAPARPVAGDWEIDMTTGVRSEQGGDTDLQDRTQGSSQGSRHAVRWSPRLRWEGDVGTGWTADLVAAPAVELPPRRSGQALSRATLSGRLRYRTPATRWTVHAVAGHAAFEAPGLWAHRRRLSAGVAAERFLRRGLSASVAFEVDGARYAAAEATADGAARRDRRQRLRTGLVAWGDRWWAAVDAEGARNGSSYPARDYTSITLSTGGGVDRGPWHLSAHVLREQRLRDGDLSDWSLLWSRLRLSRRLGSGWHLYGQAQRETGASRGERLFAPWTLWEIGLRVEWPLTRTPRLAAAPPAQPVSQDSLWVFRFPGTGAHSVHLVGSFSDWDPTAHPMRRTGDGWETALRLEPGIYEYAFVVDGQHWREPPSAPRYVDDGFGRQNGVIIVGEEGR